MSDYVIGVRGNGMAALAGAALVQSATGEVAKDADLGGAEMHAQKSGLVEYLADDDAHAIEIARDVVAGLDWPNASEMCDQSPPSAPIEDLLDIVPIDAATPFDMTEVARRIVDGSALCAFKPDYGITMLCLQARLYGKAVGIVANNGPIDTEGATKAAQFIHLCGQSGTPLIFLNNTTGFMVGTAYEQAGMIKHGSKLIQAVSNVDVPRVTIYVGASFGAGNYGMSGFAYDPDFLFSWPNSTSGVMGGTQAAGTMDLVARGIAKRHGQEVDEDQLAAQRMALTAHFDHQHSAFYTSGRCLDHGIIDPRDTRRVIGLCLDICRSARHITPRTSSYGVSRF
jgi:geranyl-CoA carboxylase beta subunit